METKLDTPPRGPPPTKYLDHSQQEEWGTYKRAMAKLKPNKWTGSPRAQFDRLQTEAEQASEEAEVTIHPDDSPESPHPYQSPRTKRRVRVIHRCNEALHPGFANRKPETKLLILRDLQNLLEPRSRRDKERMICRTARAGYYLPELWKHQMPQLRREQAKLIKSADSAAREKAREKFRERIKEKAEKNPGQLLWHIKEISASPASVAITPDGRCLTTTAELKAEAETHLKRVMAPSEADSPMGMPSTDPQNLSKKQQQNRLAFQQVLQQFGPSTSTTQRAKLSELMRPVSAGDMRDILRRIKRSSYAPGMPMVLLKELPDVALHPLANIINAILANPLEMTAEDLLAHLVLLPKNDPHDLSKVRPITMCTALYKIVAYILSSRVMGILETDSFLLPSNVGFTPHGETHHLIVAIQAIFDANHALPPSQKQHLHALLVDLTQAYDRVPWQALLQTLDHLGFPKPFQEWLLHALSNSTIYLKFPQGLSEEPLAFQATRGIKQGCPLSPILFAIFNDTLLRWIATATQSSYLDGIPPTLGYADDMALLSSGSPDTIQSQTAILNLWEKWTDQALNSSKTKILTTDLISSWNVVNESSPTKASFEKVNTFKYLGVIIHALPSTQVNKEQQQLAHTRLTKAMQRLRKLRSLPLPTASKAAVIQSAVHTLVPYGVYAIPPKLMPTRHLQVLTNQILKGGQRHNHMTNAIMQHPQVGEDAPNITNDMPFLVVAELHRLLNTPNFMQSIIKSYLKAVQTDMQWPHHPLDPATMHLRLNDCWKGSLIDIWRQWLSLTPQAARPSFVTTTQQLNPGGWTNFFSSTKFDYNTTRVNRHPWIIPKNLRDTLASNQVYNYPQFCATPAQKWHELLSIQELQQVQMHITSHSFRCSMGTNPPLRNPWQEPKIHMVGPWPKNTTTAADGAASEHYMSAAWAAATKTQFRRKQAEGIPSNQRTAQPIYGYLNSTWAETYALEGALVTTLKAGLWSTTVHAPTEADPLPPPGHAQDNQSCLDTYNKYMKANYIPEGHFVATQQARPAWRRIIAAKDQLINCIVGWKKGHAKNCDINAVDCLTELELHHRPLEEAEALFPDLQILIEGMDEFALVLTFPVQPHLPIAHPCLPTPGHARALRSTAGANDPPSMWITFRHDGTRTQLHNLWKHLLANHAGHNAPTYQFMTQSLNLKMAQEGLLLRQRGYWTTMKVTPKAGEDTAPIDSPLTGAERTLILHLRQGLWVVHTTDGYTPASPALRWCTNCDQMATLHHVLCDCAEPAMVQIRQHLVDFCDYLKQPHPHLPHGTVCGQESQFHGATPTNLANTRWGPLTQPRVIPARQASPTCLHSWLGLYPQQAQRQPYHHRIHVATLHTTSRLIHQWMQLVKDNGEHVLRKTDCHVPVPAETILPKAPRPPPPKLLHEPKPSKLRTRFQCTMTTCHTQTAHPGARCARHSTDADKRNQTRLSHKIYNAKGNRRWQPVPLRRISRSPPVWRPQAFILVSGAFAPLPEEPCETLPDSQRDSRREPTTDHADRSRGATLTRDRLAPETTAMPQERAITQPNPKETPRGSKRSPTRRASEGEPEQRQRVDSTPQLPSHIEPARQAIPKRLRSYTKAEKLAWRQKSLRPRKKTPPAPQSSDNMYSEDTVNISGPTKGRLLATQYLLRHADSAREQPLTPSDEQSPFGPQNYNITGRLLTTPLTPPENTETTPSGSHIVPQRSPLSRAAKRPLEQMEPRLRREPQQKQPRKSSLKLASPGTPPTKPLIAWGGEDPTLSSHISPTTQQSTPTPLDLGPGGSASTREGQSLPVSDQDMEASRPYNLVGSPPLGEMDVG
jgi:hypothetical protein